NCHKTANEKKRDGHCYGWKRLPKISSHQMIGEFGNKRFMRFREQSIYDRPDKHVKRTDKRHINQQSRSKWLRRQTHFFQQPSAEILQREDMTAPAADISPEDQGRQD